jgi:hypothetical protein
MTTNNICNIDLNLIPRKDETKDPDPDLPDITALFL